MKAILIVGSQKWPCFTSLNAMKNFHSTNVILKSIHCGNLKGILYGCIHLNSDGTNFSYFLLFQQVITSEWKLSRIFYLNISSKNVEELCLFLKAFKV